MTNTDLSSRLQNGEDTRTKKSTKPESSINTFEPLVCSVRESINNLNNNINPTTYVWGGMSSRSVIRNVNYLKNCHIKK